MSRPTPKTPRASEQMKAWSSALAAELCDWPEVNTKSFFGFTALYRRRQIFAVLPRTHAWANGNSLAFKIENPSAKTRGQLARDARIGSMDISQSRWFTLDLSSDNDLHDAISWLSQAYDRAEKSTKSK